MRLLTVHAHPVPESFGTAVHKRFCEAATRAGHEVRSLDLYAMGFDPVLTTEERRTYMDRDASRAGIEEHLALLKWAEGLVFVYPTWWYSLPAMLKGWLDRVLVPYDTFEIKPGLHPVVAKLDNIRLVGGISTYGSPDWWIRWIIGDPGRKVILRGVRPICARRCRTFWLGLYLMDSCPEDRRKAFLDRVDRLATGLPA